MNSKKLVWLLGGMAFITVIAGCGSLAAKVEAGKNPFATFNYPVSVPAGAPAPAQSFTQGTSGPPSSSALPTGGLAGTNGRAAPWAIGQHGALVLFMDPANPLDAQELHYSLVVVARQDHMTLDIVDTVPVTHVAPLGSADYSNPGPSPTVIGESASAQTLSQMGAMMITASKQWGLPSWVHLYVIAPQTVAAWHINLHQDPTLWIVAPPIFGISPTFPTVLGGAPDNISTESQDSALVNSTLGVPLP